MKTPREILDENSLTGKLYCHNYEGDERDYEDIIEAMQAYADQQVKASLIEFKKWYDGLSPVQKCTVWPPAGSGSGTGLYNMEDEDLIDKYLKYKIKQP